MEKDIANSTEEMSKAEQAGKEIEAVLKKYGFQLKVEAKINLIPVPSPIVTP